MHGPNKKYPHPIWFQRMLADGFEVFRKEWQVTHDDIITWAWQNTATGSDRLTEIFAGIGVKAVGYHREDLPSWGVVLDERDPVVVEYILKYGDKTE